jgi:hypothetical protein
VLSYREASHIHTRCASMHSGNCSASPPWPNRMSSLGDAKSSQGGAKSSLGDAKSSLGDAKSSLGDATSSLGDAKSSLGGAKSSLGDAKAATVGSRALVPVREARVCGMACTHQRCRVLVL